MIKVESFVHTNLTELTKEINEWLYINSKYKVINISHSSCVYKRSNPMQTSTIEFEYNALVTYDDGKPLEYVQLEEKFQQLYSQTTYGKVGVAL